MTTETLGEKQRRFTLMAAKLIEHIYASGYQATFGDAYRDPRVHGPMGAKKLNSYSAANSCHKLRLAVDLQIFKDGIYLTSTEDYTFAGKYWESIGGTWGGRFNDGNHFSIEHNGYK